VLEIYQTIFKGLVAFCVAAGAARLGIYYFFKQKEYEIVKSRYLDASVDLLLVELENGLNIVSHNYSRTLNIVKDYRDHEGEFDLSKLKKGFIDIDKTKLNMVAHHRLDALCGSDVFWSTYQLALVCFSDVNIKLTHEIMNIISNEELTNISLPKQVDTLGSQGRIDKFSVRKKQLCNRMAEKAKVIYEESLKYTQLVHQFQIIADLLEKDGMTFKQIENFRIKPEVVEVVKMIKKEFSEELCDN
jgi:hypothetical protein